MAGGSGDGNGTGCLVLFSALAVVCKCEQSRLGVTLLGRTLVLFPHFAFGKQVSATRKTAWPLTK